MKISWKILPRQNEKINFGETLIYQNSFPKQS